MSDLREEYERGEDMLRRAESEVERIKAARLNIAGAMKLCEALIAEAEEVVSDRTD